MKKINTIAVGLLLLVLIAGINSCKKEVDNNNNNTNETCTDHIQNQNETAIDCGGSCNACLICEATVTDIDGNVYHPVAIGNQCWLKENLKTTHYRDGSAIMDGNDSLIWPNILTTGPHPPAWCYYNGNTANDATYGKLYNWYAAGAYNICPTGWHVPTDAEFTQLTDFLGNESQAGGKMKSISLWNAPNTGANNSSSFTALPAGNRRHYGEFRFIGVEGYFWSSTSGSIDYAWYRSLDDGSGGINRNYSNKELGYSIRCVRD